MTASLVLVAVVQAQAQRGCITIHARSTSPHGGANTPAKADPTAQRAVVAAASTAPEGSDDRLPIDLVTAAPLLAVRALPLHAMPHTAVRCLQRLWTRARGYHEASEGFVTQTHLSSTGCAFSVRSRRVLGTRRGHATLLASIRRSNGPGRASPTARKWRMCLRLALYGPKLRF